MKYYLFLSFFIKKFFCQLVFSQLRCTLTSGMRSHLKNSKYLLRKIKVIGIRPGEKLHEELFLGNNPQSTEHPKILKAEEKFISWKHLGPDLENLKILLDQNKVNEVVNTLQKLVSGYKFNGKIYIKDFKKISKKES